MSRATGRFPRALVAALAALRVIELERVRGLAPNPELPRLRRLAGLSRRKTKRGARHRVSPPGSGRVRVFGQ